MAIHLFLSNDLAEADIKSDITLFKIGIEDDEFLGMIRDLVFCDVIPKIFLEDFEDFGKDEFTILKQEQILALKKIIEFLLTETMMTKMVTEKYYSNYKNWYAPYTLMQELDYLEVLFTLKTLIDLVSLHGATVYAANKKDFAEYINRPMSIEEIEELFLST